MNRSKPQYGLEEQLLIMIYKLIQKKFSNIFRQPVDAVKVPDYYDKIKKPIDISTMIKKLKNKTYRYCYQIRQDFLLMMANCRQFNSSIEILRMAQKFDKSIQTQWGNFEKEARRKGLDLDGELKMNQDIMANFDFIEEKFTHKKSSNVHATLGDLDGNNRRSVPQYRVLPPIPAQLITTQRGQQLPPQLCYNPLKYATLNISQKQSKLRFQMQKEWISKQFQQKGLRKIQKYRKILQSKVMWIQNKIIRRCLGRKRFQKMATPQYLSSFIENGSIANGLQIRKLQLYVKMVAYWIQEYPTILSYSMKNKFVQVCRSIKRSIFRVLRYKKLPKTTKIILDSLAQGDSKVREGDEKDELGQGKYDNQIKSFKRTLSRDQGETIKKYTKIQIRNENGQFTVVDWNVQGNQKKKQRSAAVSQAPQNTQQIVRFRKQRQRKQQRQQDDLFLASYQSKTSKQLLKTLGQSMFMDWQRVAVVDKLPQVVEMDFTKLLFT